ncbi:unnamed protein product [Effrenium voratum]|uniref:cystathionine beta-synthase n=1 Tax=Effrenium voratum TaxID=2562239 RepID=A0AA36IM16_9DINO|nr:unnamed protein product [Effrenium voratum]
MPAVMSRFGGVACRLARGFQVPTRCFASVDPVVARARELQKLPYDEKKEGEVKAPSYVGWDKEIDDDFNKLTVGAIKGGRPYEKICDSALDLIGFTPMVRMSRLSKFLDDVDCDWLGKVELFNAGGSVKDRIAKRMVEEAEKSGRIKPGDILIEATSGNTGVGLCLVSAIKGYKQIICLPQKMSGEKVNTMKCLGAEILRTPTEAAWDAQDSHIFLSARLAKDLGGHVLDQYKNPGNPLAHYDGTAEEIAEQCEGKLDYMIMSTGTGGTMTGVAKKLKELIPGVQVVGVDPYGSILAEPAEVNEKSTRTGQEKLSAYHVEGIGYDFIPTVLDREIVDHWVKTDDDEAFAMCRALVRHEGLLIGGSCGSTVAGAYRFIKENKIGKDKRCAVLLADSARNYMSKFMDDGWLEQSGFDLAKIHAAVFEKGSYDKLFHVK